MRAAQWNTTSTFSNACPIASGSQMSATKEIIGLISAWSVSDTRFINQIEIKIYEAVFSSALFWMVSRFLWNTSFSWHVSVYDYTYSQARKYLRSLNYCESKNNEENQRHALYILRHLNILEYLNFLGHIVKLTLHFVHMQPLVANK